MPGSDFLLTTWQGGGNVPPELGLARRLIGAGHRVPVLSEPTVEPDALAVGCSFTPWPTAPSIAAIDRDTAVIKDWRVRNPVGLVRRMGNEVIFGPADRFAHDVLHVLERHPADAADGRSAVWRVDRRGTFRVAHCGATPQHLRSAHTGASRDGFRVAPLASSDRQGA